MGATRGTVSGGRAAAVAGCAAALLALTGCDREVPPLIDVTPSPTAGSPTPAASPSASPAPPATPSPSASLDTSAYNQCQASVTRPSPPSGGRQTIRVRTVVPGAPVSVTLSYGGRTQSLTGTTDPGGRADILFRTLEGIRSGTTVQVDVTVASSGRCSTTFTVG